MKEQSVAYLLATFLGYLGADRFYMGQIGLGILKLITFGGFGLWWIIDIYLIGMVVAHDKDGQLLNRPRNGRSTRSLSAAFLLSSFFGYLGADRFYLGQTGLGIAKLLTVGGCGIWSVIDLYLIGMGVITDVDGNHLS